VATDARERTDDLWHTESAMSSLIPLYVTSAGLCSTMKTESVHSAEHDGSYPASVVRSVLISIEPPHQGVEGDEINDDAGATVRAAATVSVGRVCVSEREICDATNTRPPKGWYA